MIGDPIPVWLGTWSMAHGMDTSMLAKEALLEAMRGQLEALQGKPSGLMEAMPKKQRRRIHALLHMQERCDAYRSACQEKIRQAQKELREQCAPIYVARKDVVVGAREPTADETPDREEEGEGEEGGEEGEEEGKGIPDFWNVVLQSHETTESMVRARTMRNNQHDHENSRACEVVERSHAREKGSSGWTPKPHTHTHQCRCQRTHARKRTKKWTTVDVKDPAWLTSM